MEMHQHRRELWSQAEGSREVGARHSISNAVLICKSNSRLKVDRCPHVDRCGTWRRKFSRTPGEERRGCQGWRAGRKFKTNECPPSLRSLTSIRLSSTWVPNTG